MIRRDRRTNATCRDVARPPFKAKGERRGLTTRRVNTATPFVRYYAGAARRAALCSSPSPRPSVSVVQTGHFRYVPREYRLRVGGFVP